LKRPNGQLTSYKSLPVEPLFHLCHTAVQLMNGIMAET